LIEKNGEMKNWQDAIFALGVSLCVTGAFLMWNGSILGERTSGIASIIGIIGIGILSKLSRIKTKRRDA
jgi:hypothetical protein